jgi:squalene-hopene/tetraprenyl-beta-curcumene cyclase
MIATGWAGAILREGTMRRAALAAAWVWLGLAGVASAAAGPARAETFAPPGPNRAGEPRAATYSQAKAAAFLDRAAVHWTQGRKCATCHTNVPYLMARPALRERSRGEALVRGFLEGRAAGWDRPAWGAKPRWDTEVVVTAVALAFHDAQTTGKLHPLTRQALDRMWTLQQKDGAWNWLKCNWPPFEHDDYYGAVLAALGVGVAPDGYARTEKAKAGLERLRGYLRRTPPPTLHHKAWLLWAGRKVDGLMSPAEQAATVKELLALQKPDGGWCLAALGDWKGYRGRKSDPKGPSDGYGTGFVVYVLRQAGLPADHPAVRGGVAWLKANQRQSGRWFTPSLNTDGRHFISHAGTAFALLALKACE